MIKNKKGLEFSEFGKWVLVIAGAVIVLLFIRALWTGKLSSALQSITDLLRFGR